MGKRRSQIGHQVEFVLTVDLIEQCVRGFADMVFHLGDLARRECTADQAAQAGVVGRIEREHRGLQFVFDLVADVAAVSCPDRTAFVGEHFVVAQHGINIVVLGYDQSASERAGVEWVAFAQFLVGRVRIGNELRIQRVPDHAGLVPLLSQPGLDVQRGDCRSERGSE